MPPKSRFTRLDAFTKTVEDARIRTTSGGIVTLTSLLLILYLVWGEWADYRRVIVHPELMVDKGRGEKMEIHMNISFPRVPCELLTLDVMDVSGEVQTGVMHGVNKVRLRSEKEGGGEIDRSALELGKAELEATKHLDPNYCGGCYGAPSPSNAIKEGCCNTCAEVREAYAGVSWSFGRGENVEQCEREHYSEHLDEQRREGCRIEGGIRVNKVVGNFHFAPGKSFSNGNMHVHDLENYFAGGEGIEHTFTHQVHHLRFGPQLPDDIVKRIGRKGMAWSNHHLNPLDDTEQKTDEKAYNYMYFVKVVSTAYLPLGWERTGNAILDIPHELIELGGYGKGEAGSIETHQYSVTSHKRSLAGGDGTDEGHKERLHARGGIPGVFFSYDISPMKVVNREARSKSFSGFLVGVCAVIGGTLTVAAAIDRALHLVTSSFGMEEHMTSLGIRTCHLPRNIHVPNARSALTIMKPYSLAAYVVTPAIFFASSQAQLIPFYNKPSTARHQAEETYRKGDIVNQQQRPIMDTNGPNIQLPPSSSDDNTPSGPPPQGNVILSDVIGNQRQINIFAGFTRDIATVATRLDASVLNTTVLAPMNSAISALPRKPWEDPKDYAELGASAYEGQSGSDRANTNLRRFTEAHVVTASPWKEGEKVKTLAGTELWWENKGGKAVIQPGEVEVERVVSRVANGEVWMLKGALNYAA
ncbi:ER-derived vesicles protein erv46 [Elasticomyces elasticus]|uniref:Endoplasmic reticulum-Golgi intermediate compartment protein n=1 Tax=Elasticomyces elasticus TaxID=574655 RepID=A0AAN7ZN39_9PEZI|nr:ER-derived vesicles protein erv46 [Elasticomyces elasticus]